MKTRHWTEDSGESKTEGVTPVHKTAERLVVLRTRPPEPAMSLQPVATDVTDRKPARSWPRTVAEVLTDHVVLELESLDRVYLNVYQPELQTPRAVFQFLRDHYFYFVN